MVFSEREEKTMKLNLGCGRNLLNGYVNIDKVHSHGIVYADLDAYVGNTPTLPFEDNTIDEIRMSHVLEHINNTLGLMQELWRVAKPSTMLTVYCPYGSSDDADEDPTHVRRYFLQSFGYFSQPYYWRADYGYRGDWQPIEIKLLIDRWAFGQLTKEDMLYKVKHDRNVVQEMCATLTAIKPMRQPRRDLQIQPVTSFHYE
jgi:SAM-dependent methyltransferase